MATSVQVAEETRADPLDLVEQFALANDWPCDRLDTEEIAIDVAGRWSHYSLHFTWRPDAGALHFTCAFPGKVPANRKSAVHELLALANERLWLGHFGLWADEGVAMFRHSMPLRGLAGASIEQIEDLVDTAVEECERFYPAFQFVIWGGKNAGEALQAALLDTEGQA